MAEEVALRPPTTAQREAGSEAPGPIAKKRKIPGKDAVRDVRLENPLREWFIKNIHHPYPTVEERQELMKKVPHMTAAQINTFFINTRKRTGWNDIFKSLAKGDAEDMRNICSACLDPELSEQMDREVVRLVHGMIRRLNLANKPKAKTKCDMSRTRELEEEAPSLIDAVSKLPQEPSGAPPPPRWPSNVIWDTPTGQPPLIDFTMFPHILEKIMRRVPDPDEEEEEAEISQSDYTSGVTPTGYTPQNQNTIETFETGYPNTSQRDYRNIQNDREIEKHRVHDPLPLPTTVSPYALFVESESGGTRSEVNEDGVTSGYSLNYVQPMEMVHHLSTDIISCSASGLPTAASLPSGSIPPMLTLYNSTDDASGATNISCIKDSPSLGVGWPFSSSEGLYEHSFEELHSRLDLHGQSYSEVSQLTMGYSFFKDPKQQYPGTDYVFPRVN